MRMGLYMRVDFCLIMLSLFSSSLFIMFPYMKLTLPSILFLNRFCNFSSSGECVGHIVSSNVELNTPVTIDGDGFVYVREYWSHNVVII